MKNIYNIIVSAVLTLVFLTSCQLTDLCYDHYPKASFTFAWEQEWERDYGMAHQANWDAETHGFDYDFLRPDKPEWINMVRFLDDVSEGEKYFPPEGGDIVVKEKGKHSFLLYNGDTEYIVLSGMASVTDARATATSRSRGTLAYIAKRHPETRTANAPDMLYAAYLDDVQGIAVHENKPISVKMQPLVYTYVVRYEFAYGIQHVAQARGALAGMAESVYLRTGRTSDEDIIVLYDCEIKDYGIEAHVRTFGVPGFPGEHYGRADEEAPERNYTLNLEVLLYNGQTLEFNYDIEDQIANQPRGGVIVVSGINIDDSQNETEMGGDFNVDLSGWGEVDVDLPLDPYN